MRYSSDILGGPYFSPWMVRGTDREFSAVDVPGGGGGVGQLSYECAMRESCSLLTW